MNLLIQYDFGYADVVRELGYPTKRALRYWWEEYEANGEALEEFQHKKSKYADEQKRAAVDYCLQHGKSIARTMRKLGYPSKRALANWLKELAPDKRKIRPKSTGCGLELDEKAAAVIALESRKGTAKEIADELGVTREVLYNWRTGLLEGKAGEAMAKADGDASKEELEAQVARLKTEVRALQLQKAIYEGTLEIIKKDQGTDPNRLTNKEKAQLVNSLRSEWELREPLEAVDMAKSSYGHATHALEKGESETRAAARQAVIAAFEEAGGRHGHRRVLDAIDAGDGPRIGEWTARGIVKEEGLAGKSTKKRRKCSSYEGETSEAPENLLRRKDGTHVFLADAPNETWVTDATEFAVPDGKVYLSPVIDCFDGMPPSWTISTSPNAEMANSSLLGACEWLGEDDAPVIHSDRGCRYRWPGRIAICEEKGLVRSMSRKGRSPDNARVEGLFGRLKVEFFYSEDWRGVCVGQFIEMLDDCLRWYREKRIKSDLGCKSPMQYRRDQGLLAA